MKRIWSDKKKRMIVLIGIAVLLLAAVFAAVVFLEKKRMVSEQINDQKVGTIGKKGEGRGTLIETAQGNFRIAVENGEEPLFFVSDAGSDLIVENSYYSEGDYCFGIEADFVRKLNEKNQGGNPEESAAPLKSDEYAPKAEELMNLKLPAKTSFAVTNRKTMVTYEISLEISETGRLKFCEVGEKTYVIDNESNADFAAMKEEMTGFVFPSDAMVTNVVKIGWEEISDCCYRIEYLKNGDVFDVTVFAGDVREKVVSEILEQTGDAQAEQEEIFAGSGKVTVLKSPEGEKVAVFVRNGYTCMFSGLSKETDPALVAEGF